MDFGFDRVIDRRNTNCEKFDSWKKMGVPGDVLPMWVADMDFQAPECVRKALRSAAEFGLFGYSFVGNEYYEAVINWFRDLHSWQVEREWIVTTPGVVFALSAAIRAFTEKGDAVLVQPPVYYPFYSVIENNQRTRVENPLVYRDGKYSIDFADFEKKIIDNDVKLFILCSPHNPVGRVWTAEELRQIGEICYKHQVIVVSDEIHCDFAFPEYPHTPFVQACPQMADRCVICTAPSKTFNLAGLQVSNILIPGKALRARFQREMVVCSYTEPNYLSMVACTAAYTGGRDWLEACKVYMRGNLSYMRAFLAENIPAIKLVEPEGTYLAWLDCSGLGLSKEELDALFLHKAKLWLDSGSIFGEMAQQFMRVVLACPRANVVRAMEQLKKAVDDLHGGR